MKKLSFVLVTLTLVFSLMVSFGVNYATAAEKDKYGGTLKFNHTKTADVIGDPLLIRGWNHEFVDFVLQALLRASNTNFGDIEPMLASGWEMAADKSSCVFNLKKGVKFHDGTDFNAQAAKWNLQRFIDAKRSTMMTVTSIEVVDDYTLKMNLSEWNALFLIDFTKGTFMISPTAFEKNGADWVKYNPVGTGPFKVTKFKRNTVIDYEKNKDYHIKGLPYLDKVRATQIGDPMTALASLKSGDIDAWLGVDPISAAEVRDAGKFDVITTPAVHNIIQFNSTDPNSIWTDKRVRQALEYAIDKEAIAKALGKGFLFPVYEVIHSVNLQEPGPGTTPRMYNPEKARQLLKEAGVPKGIKIKVSYTSGAAANDTVVALQGMLADVGIQIVTNPLAGAVMNQMAFEVPPPNMLLLQGQRGGPGEFLSGLDESFGEGTVYFQGMKQPDGFQQMLQKALRTEDRAASLDIVFEMERRAYEDATLIALNGVLFATLQNPKLKGAVWFWAGSPFPYIEEAYFEK